MKRIKTFLRESKRVLKVTKKPSTEEFKTITKVTGLGMLAIGLVGYAITMIYMMFAR